MSNNTSNTFWSAPDPAQNDPNTCHMWTAPPPVTGYGSYPYGFRPHLPPPSPGLEGYEPTQMSLGYAFDPSVPPPPFSRPPGQAAPTMNTVQRPFHAGHLNPDSGSQVGPLNAWAGGTHNNMGHSNIQQFDQPHTNCSSGIQSSQYDYPPFHDPDSGFMQQRSYQDASEIRDGPLLSFPSFLPRGKESDRGFGKAPDAQPVDEKAVQKRQDEQWVKRFLQSRGRSSKTPESPESEPHCEIPASQIRDSLYGAVQLVSQLALACETLKDNLENESAWVDSYMVALNSKRELEEKLKVLNDRKRLDALKNKLSRITKRRARRNRRKLLQMEDELMAERFAEKEAAIDAWRMKKIREVEERKREQELKLAADSVLCEVRKKQADVKRMQDILRSLEKLRKLRKEAASRKGIFPDQESDHVFGRQLEQLRALIKKRTAVYSAEENALRVMLEGEQEEERRRDLEKRQNKERERQLRKKQQIKSMLFGDEMPAHRPLQAFREYYTQADHSLPALVQIRREWDVFLVSVDHPDGTVVPQGWVLPEPPSDKAWASALDKDDCHPDCL
ncbi:programmed cell death protein 7 [Polymixia lowei]